MQISVEINGVEYRGQVMTIHRIDMGPWGADMVSVNIDFEAGASGQGTGVFGLKGDTLVEWIRGFVRVTGVESFPEIVGKKVVVLRLKDYDWIHGVVALTDESNYFLVREPSNDQ